MITAYFLCHGLWTVIPDQLADNFKDMVDCGFTAVALSFSESEMVYSRRAFEIQVKLAHQAGLKVIVIPSRLGGRFAGAPLMPSLWLCQHPEAQVPGYHTFFGPTACLEHQPFRDWIQGFMSTILTDYPIDGIIWDEPKCENVISTHPDTLARFGPCPTEAQMEDGCVDFIQELTTHCLSINPDLVVTLFNQKASSEHFTEKNSTIAGLRYVGYDGNLARQSFFHEPAEWTKYRIESVWDRTQREAAPAGKGTFALIENMLMPAVAIPEYETNLEAYLQSYRPDHLAFYYYARRLMQKYL